MAGAGRHATTAFMGNGRASSATMGRLRGGRGGEVGRGEVMCEGRGRQEGVNPWVAQSTKNYTDTASS